MKNDIALVRADARRATFAGCAEESALAVEFIPTTKRGFDDDQVLVGDPELGLSGDNGAVLQLRSFVLMQAEFGISDAFSVVLDAGRDQPVAARDG